MLLGNHNIDDYKTYLDKSQTEGDYLTLSERE